MFERRDYIGEALGQALAKLGAAWGDKIARDGRNEEAGNILNSISSTDPQGGWQTPFVPKNYQALARLKQVQPAAYDVVQRVDAANRPGYWVMNRGKAGVDVFEGKPGKMPARVAGLPPFIPQANAGSNTQPVRQPPWVPFAGPLDDGKTNDGDLLQKIYGGDAVAFQVLFHRLIKKLPKGYGRAPKTP